jgi:cytochrome c biogenesis protein CcmG, thiol:disulfide interchange protein DsbE
MFNFDRSWAIVVAASFAVAGMACQQKAAEKPAETPTIPAVAPEKAAATEEPESQPASKVERKEIEHKAVEHKAVVHKPKPQELPPPPPSIPKVSLSAEIRAACVVNVGNTMPEAELPDTRGKMHALGTLYGQKLTVVCFWTSGANHHAERVATTTLQDLMKTVVEPFEKKGVRVIGINVNDPPAAIQQAVNRAGVQFPILLDPKGEFFAKVAKDKRMPRTYLLDAAGQILWFDVQYSPSLRRNTVQSIRVALGEL